MTSTFKKPNFVLIILTFFCLTSNAQIANSKFNLTSETYFQCFSFLLPNNLTRKSHTDNENKFNIIVYENEKDSIDVMIRKKEANTDLKSLKELGESMATSFYNGKVDKSEIKR